VAPTPVAPAVAPTPVAPAVAPTPVAPAVAPTPVAPAPVIAAAPASPLVVSRESEWIEALRWISQKFEYFEEDDLIQIKAQEALYTPDLFSKLKWQDLYEARRQYWFVLFHKAIAIVKSSPVDVDPIRVTDSKLYTQKKLEWHYKASPEWYAKLHSELIQILKDSVIWSTLWSSVADEKKSKSAAKYQKQAEDYSAMIAQFGPAKMKLIIETWNEREQAAPAVAAAPEPARIEQDGKGSFAEITRKYDKFEVKKLESVLAQEALYTGDLFKSLKGQDLFEAKRQHGYVLLAKVFATLDASPTAAHGWWVEKLDAQYKLEWYYQKDPTQYASFHKSLMSTLETSIVASSNAWESLKDEKKRDIARGNKTTAQKYLALIAEFTPQKIKNIVEERKRKVEAERVTTKFEISESAMQEFARLWISLEDGNEGAKRLKFSSPYTIQVITFDTYGAKKWETKEFDTSKLTQPLPFRPNTISLTFQDGVFTVIDSVWSKQEIRFQKKEKETLRSSPQGGRISVPISDF
jgi:hypothetical protein